VFNSVQCTELTGNSNCGWSEKGRQKSGTPQPSNSLEMRKRPLKTTISLLFSQPFLSPCQESLAPSTSYQQQRALASVVSSKKTQAEAEEPVIIDRSTSSTRASIPVHKAPSLGLEIQRLSEQRLQPHQPQIQ
jgi:hypothetical protein